MIDWLDDFEQWLFELPSVLGWLVLLLMSVAFVAFVIAVIVGLTLTVEKVAASGIAWTIPYAFFLVLGFCAGWAARGRGRR